MDLEDRFSDFWKRIGAKTPAEHVYHELLIRYLEKHRHYHTLDHIAFSLGEFDKVSKLTENPNAMEFAIWFHDAVYDVGNSHPMNEANSANLAMSAAMEAGLGERKEEGFGKKFVQKIVSLILSTVQSYNPIEFEDKLMRDIDLAILGQPFNAYNKYRQEVRQEFKQFNDRDYAFSRTNFLIKLLERKDELYQTSQFRDRLLFPARQNIKREIEILRK